MTRYSFILLSGDEKTFLPSLQELGLVDITRSVKPVDASSGEMLDMASALNALIAKLEAFSTEAPAVVIEGDLAEGATRALSELHELDLRHAALQKEILSRTPWGEFDAEAISHLEAQGLKVRFHVVLSKAFREEWADEYPLEVISESDGKKYFVTVVPEGEDVAIPSVTTPEGDWKAAEAEDASVLDTIRTVEGRIRYAREHIDELRSAYSAELSRLDLYLADAASVRTGENTIITLEGFAPTESDAEVSKYLDKTGVFYLKEAASVETNPPIKFRNNKFVRMFEVLTDMYGRPSYDGFDPTPFISVFFLLFFAFCMGDAGYGLLLILVGLGLKKVASFKDLAPLVVTLGIGTTLVGFFFHTFFSMDISTWSIFEPVKWLFLPQHLFGLSSFDAAMVLAILIGVFHICLALVVKTVAETRRKGFLESLGTWGWTLLIVGGVIVGGIALTGVISSEVTKWVIIVLGVLSALGIFFFNNIHRNPLVNVGSGLWETYNTVTGLLGDVLSYLRLYALGLAGAKLGEAFNAIGQMVLGDGTSIPLWMGFILIVVVGHTLNLAMCALGAFVHPLRLNFLEFFKNSGYEASGRNFNPLKKQ